MGLNFPSQPEIKHCLTGLIREASTEYYPSLILKKVESERLTLLARLNKLFAVICLATVLLLKGLTNLSQGLYYNRQKY